MNDGAISVETLRLLLRKWAAQAELDLERVGEASDPADRRYWGGRAYGRALASRDLERVLSAREQAEVKR